MNTVLYFELKRKKERLLRYIVGSIVFSVILFVMCVVVDVFFPDFNRNYMKWPDMLKDVLCLKSWSSHLWFNVWQFFTLAYPFYLIYMAMTGLAEAILEEDRLETAVYLHNAGVGRKTIFLTKWLVWTVETVCCCSSLLLVNVVFAVLLRSSQGIFNALKYYGGLFLVCMLYLSIALFLAACKGKKGISDDMVMAILLLPWLVSRIPAVLRFFAALLKVTGREGNITDRVLLMGEKLDVLTIVSPLTWSWPAFTIQAGYVFFGIIVFMIMSGTAFSIYTHRKTV